MSETEKPDAIEDTDLDQVQGAGRNTRDEKETRIDPSRLKPGGIRPEVKRMERVFDDE